MTKLEQAMTKLTDVASLGYRYGERNSTYTKMNVPVESIGIIDSTMTSNGTLYAIIRRTKNVTEYGRQGHDITEYYNCKGDVSVHSPFELLIPITNINLNRDVIDPLKLIKDKVLVTEINRHAMKAEYIGELTELNESPLNVPRVVLKSMRNYIGGFVPLNTSEDVAKERMAEFGLSQKILDDISKYTVESWSGKSIRHERDAVSYRDVKEAVEGEIVIPADDSIGQLIKHLNGLDMKTKKCHLPVKIFSAR